MSFPESLISSAFKPSLLISLKPAYFSLTLQLKIWNGSGIKGNRKYFENMRKYMDVSKFVSRQNIVYFSGLGATTGRLFLTLCDLEKVP